jgi:hypothetical protein
MVRRKPKAIFRGDTNKKSHIATKATLQYDLHHPDQEWWPGLPPARHRSKHITLDTPGVREFLSSGKRYPKYAFSKDGKKKVFIFLQ